MAAMTASEQLSIVKRIHSSCHHPHEGRVFGDASPSGILAKRFPNVVLKEGVL
jgi:hypothetical protein